jgi:hypothetical protein
VFYVAYYLSAVCFLAVLFAGSRVRRSGLRVFVVLVVITIASSTLAHTGISRFNSDNQGVVIADRAGLMSGPGAAFDELARLPDGVEVKIRARSGLWVEVELPTGEIGWLQEQDIELI